MTPLFADIDVHQAAWTITVAALASVPCALVGCFLLLRRMSLLGDAIGHGILPGIALAVLLTGQLTSIYLLIGAMVFGVLTAVLTELLTSVGDVAEDASLGVVFTSMFALGVVIITRFLSNVHLDVACVFAGNLEWVPLRTMDALGFEFPDALPTMALTLLLTLGFLVLFWKELKIVAFDAGLAQAMGFSPTLVSYLLIAFVAGATVSAFEAVGAVLVLSMLVVPAATAHLLTDRLGPMLAWSALLAVSCSVLGYVFAVVGPYSTNVAGMMAVVAGAQFALAATFSPRHGWLIRLSRHLQMSFRIAGEEILAALYRGEEEGTAAYAVALKEHGLPSVVVSLAHWNLTRVGLIETSPDGRLALTQKGRRVAQHVVRSHRLWETFAGQVLELPPDHVHAPASRMEHYIGPQLQAELAESLQEPAHDPHGKTIPPGTEESQDRTA